MSAAFAAPLLVSGCGGASPSYGGNEATADTTGGEEAGGAAEPMMVMLTPEEQSLVDGFDAELESFDIDYGAAMQSAGEIDCDAASGLKDSICDLADRICDISQRHPEEPSIAEKCQAGQERCERAENDIASVCS